MLRHPDRFITAGNTGQAGYYLSILALIESSSLTGLVLLDDEKTFGRVLLDSVIEYVMETAEEELSENRCRQ